MIVSFPFKIYGGLVKRLRYAAFNRVTHGSIPAPATMIIPCSSMVERVTVNHVVAGSSPTVGAIWGINSVGRVPALHAGSQEFKPPILHQYMLV